MKTERTARHALVISQPHIVIITIIWRIIIIKNQLLVSIINIGSPIKRVRKLNACLLIWPDKFVFFGCLNIPWFNCALQRTRKTIGKYYTHHFSYEIFHIFNNLFANIGRPTRFYPSYLSACCLLHHAIKNFIHWINQQCLWWSMTGMWLTLRHQPRVGCIKTNDGRKSFTVQPKKGIEHALSCYTHKESF